MSFVSAAIERTHGGAWALEITRRYGGGFLGSWVETTVHANLPAAVASLLRDRCYDESRLRLVVDGVALEGYEALAAKIAEEAVAAARAEAWAGAAAALTGALNAAGRPDLLDAALHALGR